MSRFAVLLVCVALAVFTVPSCNATTILWTGIVGDNQWTTQNNWYPNQVPGPNDDVTIEKGQVLLTIPTGVNSLTMGFNVDTPANLTIYKAFAVGAGNMNVKANGNLIQDTGLDAITGDINIDGTWTFGSGYASGQWTISSRGKAYFPGGGQRNLVAGIINNQGSLKLSGVVGFNMSAVLKNTGTITGSGELQFMIFDQSNAQFDSSAGSIAFTGSVMRFQVPTMISALSIGGGNIECYNTVTFYSPLSIPSGTTLSTLGNAKVTFNGAISGPGALIAQGKFTNVSGSLTIASITAGGGNTYFTQGGQVQSATLSGGTTNFGSTLISSALSITGGILQGSGSIQSTGAATINTAGTNVGSNIFINGTGTVAGKSLIAFGGGSITISPNASLSMDGPFTITGPSNSGLFTNNGAVSIAGSFMIQNINIGGSGTFAVSGSISMSTNTFTSGSITLSGSGTVSGSNAQINIAKASTASTYVVFKGGDYTVKCKEECDAISSPSTPQSFTISSA